MQQILEHYERNRDRPRVLANAVEQAYTTMDRGLDTKRAYRILRDWGDAEDAVQLTYQRLLEFVERGSIVVDNFDGYFAIALRNACIRVKQHKKGLPVSNSEEAIEKVLDIPHDVSPQEIAEEFRDSRIIVDKVVRRLSQRKQDVLKLIFDYGHTPAEVAQLLDIPVRESYNAMLRLKEGVNKLCG